MPWFKVDDSLWGSPKWIGLAAGARALWVTAGSWCMDQMTDGRVPVRALGLLGGRRRDADALVEAGLWERDGDGWRFHRWASYQPSRQQVEAEREGARERQRRARERAASARRAPDESASDGWRAADSTAASAAAVHQVPGDTEGIAAGQQRASRRDADVTSTVTHAGVTVGVTVPPTRPDPTRPTTSSTETSSPSTAPAAADAGRATKPTRGTRVPDPFDVTLEMREWAQTECPGLDHRAATEAFLDYWRATPGARGVKLDWVATWRNWMRREHEQRAQPRGSERPRPGTAVWDRRLPGVGPRPGASGWDRRLPEVGAPRPPDPDPWMTR